MEVYVWMEFPPLISGLYHWRVPFFFQPIYKTQRESTGRPVAWHIIKQAHQHPNQEFNSARRSWIMPCRLCFLKRAVFSIWCDALHLENNEAVIKMIIQGRSPTMRHVSRTHRVALWLVIWQNQFGYKDSNQIRSHQTPTRRHIDKGQFHTWWMEQSAPFV